MCLQSWHQIPRKIFRWLRLRFHLSFFPGSHHVPWQTYYTKCSWNHSQHQGPYFKQQNSKTCTQQLKHDKYRNQANQEQLQPFFMMSPSDLSATPSSECLQERCSRPSSLRDIWQQNETQTANKATCKSKPCHSAYSPLLNSRQISVLSHIVLSENNKWTSSWQNQLFSCCHTRRIQVPLALTSGAYPTVFARPLYLDIP